MTVPTIRDLLAVHSAKQQVASLIRAEPDKWVALGEQEEAAFKREAAARGARLQGAGARLAPELRSRASRPDKPQARPATDHYYQALQRAVSKGPPCIDQVTPDRLHPGKGASIYGTNFGDSPGAVPFCVFASGTTNAFEGNLALMEWTETRIDVEIPFDIVGVGHTMTCLQVRRADGELSWGANVPFDPRLRYLIGATDLGEFGGGPIGRKYDGIANNGVVLPFDLRVLLVTIQPNGSLTAPMAQDTSMAQGWHVGVKAWHHASAQVYYHVLVPVGFPDPDVPGVGSFQDMGEYDPTTPA